ncbi:MAG TPA: hypothetical protein VGE01_05375, partial [Fimbriimonas sp.]
MTPLQNFHQMMRGDPYEWVPFDLPMTPPIVDEMERQTGTRDAGKVFRIDFRHVWADGPSDSEKWRAAYERLGV